MRKLLYALPVILALPFVVQAANHKGKGKHEGHMMQPAKAPVDISKISGGSYVADASHTLVGWRVTHFGFNDYFGLFGSATGTLVLDTKNPSASKVEITIPISKVTTASAGLTEHLMRAGKDGGKPDFFGPAAADAKFVSTSVQATGQIAMINGNLTMNGVTKPVMLHANLSGAGTNMFNKKETVGFHAKTSIIRSEWGLGYGAPVAVSDKVELDITVAFEKAG
jgi:polyisoprenoid-binding protein YceI